MVMDAHRVVVGSAKPCGHCLRLFCIYSGVNVSAAAQRSTTTMIRAFYKCRATDIVAAYVRYKKDHKVSPQTLLYSS